MRKEVNCERGYREMKRLKMTGFILLISFLIPGCAMDRASKMPSERIVIEREPLEKVEALMDQVKGLEKSMANLDLKINRLEDRLRSIQTRPPLSHYRLPGEVTLCGERIPLEDRNVWENLDREFIVTLDSHAQILLWMKRARRYFPHIDKRLKELNLPDDLQYVAITESSLRSHAVSSSGAAGVWEVI